MMIGDLYEDDLGQQVTITGLARSGRDITHVSYRFTGKNVGITAGSYPYDTFRKIFEKASVKRRREHEIRNRGQS